MNGRSKILVVDDSGINRKILIRMLKSFGYLAIAEAASGEEALQMVRANPIDLVLLDVIMPGMDGFEVCQAIRSDFSHADLPIIMQTTLNDPEDRVRAFEAGATDYITKPINVRELQSRLLILLENKHLVRQLRDYQAQMERELRAARTLQESRLPDVMTLNRLRIDYGIDMNGFFAASHKLGGDFWGVQFLNHSMVGLYTVDVSGHGVEAALNAFWMSSLFDEALTDPATPAHYLGHLNERLCRYLPREHFATACYVVIDRDAGLMRWSTAGCAGYITRPDGTAGAIPGKSLGPPLGIISEVKFGEIVTPWQPGGEFMIFSDGLLHPPETEAAWTTADLAELMEVEGSLRAFSYLKETLDGHFTGGLPDDLTLLAGRCL